MQILGTTDEVSAAATAILRLFRSFDAASSRAIARLRETWDKWRGDGESDSAAAASAASAGGRAPSSSAAPPHLGDRSSGAETRRYEPYSGAGRAQATYSAATPRGSEQPQTSPSGHPLVVVPQGSHVPGIPGPLPTVLIQQADGTLVQVR